MYDELVKRLRLAQAVLSRNKDLIALLSDAADAIEELLSERDEVNADSWKTAFEVERDEHRWIPVEERLPEIRKVVLITDGIDVGTGWMNQGWWNTSFADIQQDAVTHWMPLPPPPKEESNGV